MSRGKAYKKENGGVNTDFLVERRCLATCCPSVLKFVQVFNTCFTTQYKNSEHLNLCPINLVSP